MITQIPASQLSISWPKLPEDFPLPDNPVELAQPRWVEAVWHCRNELICLQSYPNHIVKRRCVVRLQTT